MRQIPLLSTTIFEETHIQDDPKDKEEREERAKPEEYSLHNETER